MARESTQELGTMLGEVGADGLACQRLAIFKIEKAGYRRQGGGEERGTTGHNKGKQIKPTVGDQRLKEVAHEP